VTWAIWQIPALSPVKSDNAILSIHALGRISYNSWIIIKTCERCIWHCLRETLLIALIYFLICVHGGNIKIKLFTACVHPHTNCSLFYRCDMTNGSFCIPIFFTSINFYSLNESVFDVFSPVNRSIEVWAGFLFNLICFWETRENLINTTALTFPLHPCANQPS
jgi:hypothetical protein